MLKNIAYKKFIITTLSLLFTLLIYNFPSLKNDSIKQIIIENNNTSNLYVTNNNLLTLINVSIPKKQDEIEYKILLLTLNSINSTLLPINFLGVLPQNTKLLNYKINEQILTLNFSEEILNSKDFNKIIESLVYSFIDNKNIKALQILVNSKLLTSNPNNNEKLPNIITKDYGINKKYNINNTKNITKTTIYYQSIINNNKYYVPITSYSNNNKEKLEIIVNEMQKTPIYEDNLISFLTTSYKLKEYEINNDSITMNFQNNLLYSFSNENIEEEIIYTLSNSLMDTYNISNIYINFN